jgi:GNAT superfamily N-acetyltransferase
MEFVLHEYRPEYRNSFELLNKDWLEEYFSIEPLDKWVLENPEEAILKDGGMIYFLEHEDHIIGTVALKKIENSSFELTKMAVAKLSRGIGVGKFICAAAIEKARQLNASRLILYSQTSLVPAISTYRKLGFKGIPLEKGKYERADIKMEIVFNQNK